MADGNQSIDQVYAWGKRLIDMPPFQQFATEACAGQLGAHPPRHCKSGHDNPTQQFTLVWSDPAILQSSRSWRCEGSKEIVEARRRIPDF